MPTIRGRPLFLQCSTIAINSPDTGGLFMSKKTEAKYSVLDSLLLFVSYIVVTETVTWCEFLDWPVIYTIIQDDGCTSPIMVDGIPALVE